MAVSDIFPPGSPSPCKAGRKTASDFSRNDTAEPCPGQEERSSDMINAHCQQIFITILSLGYRGLSTQILRCSCPVGRGWTTSQRHCPVQESRKGGAPASGRLAASCLAGFVLTSPHVGSHHHPLHHGHPSTQLIPVSSGRSDSHPVGIAEHIIPKRKKTNNFTMLHIRWH